VFAAVSGTVDGYETRQVVERDDQRFCASWLSVTAG
jgi:hypothetical protein